MTELTNHSSHSSYLFPSTFRYRHQIKSLLLVTSVSKTLLVPPLPVRLKFVFLGLELRIVAFSSQCTFVAESASPNHYFCLRSLACLLAPILSSVPPPHPRNCHPNKYSKVCLACSYRWHHTAAVPDFPFLTPPLYVRARHSADSPSHQIFFGLRGRCLICAPKKSHAGKSPVKPLPCFSFIVCRSSSPPRH